MKRVLLTAFLLIAPSAATVAAEDWGAPLCWTPLYMNPAGLMSEGWVPLSYQLVDRESLVQYTMMLTSGSLLVTCSWNSSDRKSTAYCELMRPQDQCPAKRN